MTSSPNVVCLFLAIRSLRRKSTRILQSKHKHESTQHVDLIHLRRSTPRPHLHQQTCNRNPMYGKLLHKRHKLRFRPLGFQSWDGPKCQHNKHEKCKFLHCRTWKPRTGSRCRRRTEQKFKSFSDFMWNPRVIEISKPIANALQ